MGAVYHVGGVRGRLSGFPGPGWRGRMPLAAGHVTLEGPRMGRHELLFVLLLLVPGILVCGLLVVVILAVFRRNRGSHPRCGTPSDGQGETGEQCKHDADHDNAGFVNITFRLGLLRRCPYCRRWFALIRVASERDAKLECRIEKFRCTQCEREVVYSEFTSPWILRSHR